ncbi:ATP-binding protein [Shimia sp. MMG029]|uniref:ATP-binding protein n=1 Tax=Shimia sp. MMG029 TaxID=3021978 RepID=UPI0022FE5D79|nr:ATP-binding protein [Shimia sp. MMG029]MDA5558599.1 ATP-binding protein [Shimia sp. MMG029]
MARLRTTKRILRLRSGVALSILLVASIAAMWIVLAGREAVATQTRNTTCIDTILLSLSEMAIALHQIEDADNVYRVSAFESQIRQAVVAANEAHTALSDEKGVNAFSPAAQDILRQATFNPLQELSEVISLAEIVVDPAEADEATHTAANLASDLAYRLMPFFDRIRQYELEAAEVIADRQVIYGAAALLVSLCGVVFAALFAHLPMEQYVLNAQRDIERSQRAAEAASEAKTMFLATMSHEIRTPLNGVLGLADVLSDTKLDPDQRRMLGMISSSGNNLLQMINDILDLAKLEAGKTSLEFVDFDLEMVCRETTELFSGQAVRRNVRLNVESAHSEAGWYLHGAQGAVRQILSNLVGNAVKFTENGTVSVRLEDVPGPEGAPRFVRLSVRDEGIGISPDSLKRIFDQFEQADASTTTRFGGTGLGLAIVKHLTETMNGHVQVSSVVDEGSEFSLVFPVAKALARKQASKTQFTNTFDKRVLVADDNKVNQMVAQKLLQKLGCDVQLASNGLEAVNMARSWAPDLILMDVRMPVMDGLQATRAIRMDASIPSSATLPIVGLSANTRGEHEEAITTVGMSGYLHKPINREALLTELMRHWTTEDADDLDPNDLPSGLSA